MRDQTPQAPVVRHRLTDAELSTLSLGIPPADLVGRLIAAERSKHRLLVEAVRRRAERTRPANDIDVLNSALTILSEIELHAPDVVANLLGLPQVGSWATSCLRRMAAVDDDQLGAAGEAPLSNDLRYLAAVAAAAGLQTRHPFDLAVPLHKGILVIPGLGMVKFGLSGTSSTARLRLNEDTAVACTRASTVVLPIGHDSRTQHTDRRWSSLPRVQARANGLELDVVLDAWDPFLAHVGNQISEPSAIDLASWQRLVRGAWQILVRHHRVVAQAFAAMVGTLVPLAGSTAQPASATSGWTFGAIGLSLPRDAVSLAEVFVHELHHLVLGAVEDVIPLVANERDDRLYYAPWRDDPRPASGLLHGCYAYLGMTAFWRTQRSIGPRTRRLRGEVEFARWRREALDAATSLATSPALTETGARFVTGIRQQLASWRGEPISAEAELMATEASTEHRVRWRLCHLRAVDSTINVLVEAWLAGGLSSRQTHRQLELLRTAIEQTGTTLLLRLPQKGQAPTGNGMRSYLLDLRYRDPAQFQHLLDDSNGPSGMNGVTQVIDEADIALLRGDNATAARAYMGRLGACEDHDAWVGLAIVMGRMGPPTSALLLVERPELVAALYAKLRTYCGQAPNLSHFLECLARTSPDTGHQG